MNISIEDAKAEKLHLCFGIDDERSADLRYGVDRLFVENPQLRTSEAIKMVAEKTRSLEELAYSTFYLGTVIQFKFHFV
jgi:hypothetical protein